MKTRKKKHPTCSVCMYPIQDKLTLCHQCNECTEVQSDEDASYQSDEESDVACFLCDGDCTCRKGKKPSAIQVDDVDDEESVVADTPQVEYRVADMWVETGTDDDASLSELDFSTSSDESVYEEPDTLPDCYSDEDIMVEIVREKILNGWTSDEVETSDHDAWSQEDVYLTAQMGAFDSTRELISATPLKRKADDLEQENEEETTVVISREKTPFKTPSTLNTTPVNSTSQQSPWVALASINNNTILNSTASKMSKNSNSAAQLTKNMLKKPLNMASVASAAAALMNSPAALRALSELRKRDPKNQKPAVTPLKEFSLEDILDQDQFDDETTLESPLEMPNPTNAVTPFTRKVPLSTFYYNQKRHKSSRQKDLSSAMKKSSSLKFLDATLLETMPTSKRKKNGGMWVSPSLDPVSGDFSLPGLRLPK